jgi:hypothetical protein
MFDSLGGINNPIPQSPRLPVSPSPVYLPLRLLERSRVGVASACASGRLTPKAEASPTEEWNRTKQRIKTTAAKRFVSQPE